MPYKDREKRLANSRVYSRAYRAAHLEESRAYDCTRRETHYTWREIHLEETRAHNRAYYMAHREEITIACCAYREEHREANRIYAHDWRIVHKDEQRAYQVTHLQEGAERTRRRRAWKRGTTIGPIDLVAIRQRDKMLCAICGRKVAEKDFSLDHTIPLSLGGPHTQDNLRVAHRRCNSRRGAGRLPVQMILV